jgi:hypothetical protein
MADYLPLDTVHRPTDGAPVPAAWGHGIRQNLDALHRPCAFSLAREAADGFDLTVTSDNLTDLAYNRVLRHTGEFFDPADQVATFVAPVDGYYAAYCEMAIALQTITATTSVFVALLRQNDADASHYLMRSAHNVVCPLSTLGGIFRAAAGTKLSFVAYQNSGMDSTCTGTASVVYLGRKL